MEQWTLNITVSPKIFIPLSSILKEILQCGHCYCVDCIQILIKEYSQGKSTKCAVCRWSSFFYLCLGLGETSFQNPSSQSVKCGGDKTPRVLFLYSSTQGTRRPMQRSPTWARNSRRKMIFILRKFEAVIPQRWLFLCFTKMCFISLYSQVEAVVKSLIKIRSEDSEAKSLVFSTWTGKFGDKLGLCFLNILPDK